MSKQLFNSSEESNFILNMTEEKYSQLASYGLSLACFTTAVFAVIPEFIDTLSYSIVSGGLAISGVICMILALIGIIKKYINFKNLSLWGFVGMIVWGIISMINSYSVSVSFYGFSGRGEGLLAIIFYFGFFITAMSVKREKVITIIINSIIASGLLHSTVGLIQVFTGKLSHYQYASITTKINAASGLAQSPIFLAMVLSLALTASLVTAVLTNNKKRRIFCIVSSCLFTFVMMFTYSLMGITGIIIALLSAGVSLFIKKSPKIRLMALLSGILPAIVAVLIVNSGIIGGISSYKLYDGYTLWWADSYMRLSASGNCDPDNLDLSDTVEVYKYLNRKAIDIIKKYALTGTGEDQLVYPQLYTNGGLDPERSDISDIIARNINTFDKVYNEYLYTAATRGIPSLIALVLILGSVLIAGFRKIKKSPSENTVCMFMMFICGIIIFFIGCSNITFSPVFWVVSGLLISTYSENK
ncbi:MAG: O-antigen ligase family protein [Muribaculaceae bacterium]|nr:O-antigen ligase family protein [Alistipes senegalensis]MCM1472964.1 O-antigen ligase family protein [Muribaculaceae bacterium]